MLSIFSIRRVVALAAHSFEEALEARLKISLTFLCPMSIAIWSELAVDIPRYLKSTLVAASLEPYGS